MKVMITGDEWGMDVGRVGGCRVEAVLNSLHTLSRTLGENLYITHLDQPSGADRVVDSWALRRLDADPRVYLTPGFNFDNPVMLGSEFDLTIVFFGPRGDRRDRMSTLLGRAAFRAAKAGAPVKMVLWEEQ